ncbi:MAG: hypothetical protein JO356_01640 [Acidobacteria bacterium]|nr:hypothetical protein [Acidobacteriota bacterium]
MNAVGVSKIGKRLLLVLVLVSATAWAESKGSLDLQHRTNVGGTQLASGKYTVRWEGAGDQVEVKIYNGRKLMATTPARVVKVDSRQHMDTALVNSNQDGSQTLSEIRFGGKDYVLHIQDAGGGGAAASGAAK